MKTIYCIIFLLCYVALLPAQTTANPTSFLYENVTIHIGNGQTIAKGKIGVRDGKIDWVAVSETKPTATYDKTIDGKGQHIYPGLIAPNTRLGLEEVEAVRSTRDFREVGLFNPNVRSIIAYNTDSQIIPTIRSNGVLLAQIVPQGGRISGQSSVAYTEAYNWEDAAVQLDNVVHLRWPSRIRYAGWWAYIGATYRNKNYDRALQEMKVYFDAAKAYAQKETVEKKNLKFETMKALFSKDKKLFIHADDAKEMMDAVKLLESYGVDIVIQGGADSWKIADFLAEKKIPVVLHNVHSLPRRDDEDIDQPYRTPALLHAKGVKFCFSMEGSWQVRNLPFQAGQAVGYGLPKEVALSAITLTTAEILGINKQLGSLEKGKEATFIISEGDVLDMRTSVITEAYIAGKKVDLGNKQKALYEKYNKKYDLEEK